MTTDTDVLGRALVVMAICMAIQTVMLVGLAVGAFIAWRRATAALADAKALAEAQASELRERFEHVSATVDEAAQALIRGTATADGVMNDLRDAMGSVRSSVGSVASVVTGPRTAIALGLLKGLQTWRNRRDAQRAEDAASSDL
jgi:hypothetical protein